MCVCVVCAYVYVRTLEWSVGGVVHGTFYNLTSKYILYILTTITYVYSGGADCKIVCATFHDASEFLALSTLCALRLPSRVPLATLAEFFV